MDMLDRIAALLRSLFADPGSADRPKASGSGPGPSGSTRPADPDLAAAWDELNDYLGEDASGSGGGRTRPASSHGGSRSASPPESLRGDYANLEVPFGADSETVRRSYKRLVLRYHPDRHGGSPEKQRVATEITKKVNESFERIRGFQERNPGER